MNQMKWALKHGKTVNRSEKDNTLKKKNKTLQLSKKIVTPKLKKKIQFFSPSTLVLVC